MPVAKTCAFNASFRDPSGFVFRRDGNLFRQINQSYRTDYDRLMNSGLYQRLVDDRALIAHAEAEIGLPDPEAAYKAIRPQPVPFISYPYEWCFGQLKDAALLTLTIQRRALEYGMALKDASAYNVQFKEGRPVFIDTLSFEEYREGEPWVAYRQFCQHFLAPLALMSLTDVRLNQLTRANIDGIPLDLAARLLPFRSRFRPALAIHLILHARFSTAYAFTDQEVRKVNRRFGRRSLLALLDSLESAILGLRWQPQGTPWSEYYLDNSYTEAAQARKEHLVEAYLERINPSMAWDLGANTGRFSRLAAARKATTVAFDLDPGCVELNYREVSHRGETHVLPLLLDVANPSPSLGWRNRERDSLLERGPADTVLALALVHHLAIANNLPLIEIAEFLNQIGRSVIIEFVPKGDSQVRRLLRGRKDVFPDYHQAEFERCFQRYFEIESSESLPDSQRIVYLMRTRAPHRAGDGSSTHS
jgi:ribosomal protein L11 methylase PrmA